jgi:TolB-like protein/DNA-binding winged helix-turn-helix (wHTH) protein/Flp pilus assembly protein TadD
MPAHLQATKAQFAGFELDLRSSELVKDGRRLRLQGQPFRVLTLLLEHAGEVVTRDELRQLLWPQETFVDFDHGLNKAIAKLRDALDSSDNGTSMIETLPRRGYRFLPGVQWIAAEDQEPAVVPLEPAVLPAPAERSAPEATPARPRSTLRRATLRWVLPTLLLLALVGSGVARWRGQSRPTVQSLAVLPLQNLSNNPDEEYFADGMTDELITDLAHIRSLRVISHASVIALKQTSLTMPEIADRLHVDAVVEGTILRSGDRLRITVQLVAAHPEQHLWAASYERPLGDAVTLQNEIATAAAAQIRAQITPAERAQLAAATPVNAEAHDEYLRARFFIEQETPEQLVKATPHLERAIQLAPGYADAYAQLGEVWLYRGIDGLESNRTTSLKAISYGQKAIQLDPDSSEGYEALGAGLTLMHHWKDGETALRHSLELNPNNPRAAEELAILLDMLHRGPEAISLMRESAAANPVSVRSQRMFANVLFRARHFDEAIAQCHRALELDPNRGAAYFILGNSLAAKGRYAEAGEAFAHLPADRGRLVWLAALRGDREQARRLLAEKKLPADSVYLAAARYLLGDREAALAEIDRLTNQEWQIRTYFLNCEMVYDPMRGDPRFVAILRKTGLPE